MSTTLRIIATAAALTAAGEQVAFAGEAVETQGPPTGRYSKTYDVGNGVMGGTVSDAVVDYYLTREYAERGYYTLRSAIASAYGVDRIVGANDNDISFQSPLTGTEITMKYIGNGTADPEALTWSPILTGIARDGFRCDVFEAKASDVLKTQGAVPASEHDAPVYVAVCGEEGGPAEQAVTSVWDHRVVGVAGGPPIAAIK